MEALIGALKASLESSCRICKEGQKGIGAKQQQGDDDDEVYGEFEDLQTGEVFTGPGAGGGGADSDDDDASDDGDDEDLDEEGEDIDDDGYDSEEIEEGNDQIDAKLRDLNAQKKANRKSLFDADYDLTKTSSGSNKTKGMSLEEAEDEKLLETAKLLQQQQRARNKTEFGEEGEQTRLLLEGYRQGLYVRILLKHLPVEFIQNFHPTLPTVLGGLQPQEGQAMGYIRARVKRHRWHRKVLKSYDPLIFSIGWRRYQSMPVYCIEDINERDRFLKYTPEHMHCIAYFYGPLIPPNTAILAYQKAHSTNNDFRISLTGTALESQTTPTVMKKLKLVGYPQKIFKNTAFVHGMFNSALEVAKFEGAKLKTVSGIRGTVKKAITKDGEPGRFRATFEDKILMSDIIVCRLWVPVEIKNYYNPVLSLLTSDPEAWRGMRTVATIRKEESIPLVIDKDSVYKPIERVERVFPKLKISSKLQASLPYASKLKQKATKNKKSYMSKRTVSIEPEMRKQRAVLQLLSTIRKDKVVKRATAQTARNKRKSDEVDRQTAKFEDVTREEKKRSFRDYGQKMAKRSKKE